MKKENKRILDLLISIIRGYKKRLGEFAGEDLKVHQVLINEAETDFRSHWKKRKKKKWRN